MDTTIEKFERKRIELQKKFEEEMRKLEESEKAQVKKIVKPLGEKFANVMQEEFERFGEENLVSVEGYKFSKADVKAKLRKFLEEEFNDQ